MSVYTLLNQNQIEALLAQYAITDLESYKEISDGIENSNYLIRASGKEYVLTIFERDASTNFTPYLSFMANAQEQGKAVPCPLLNTSNKRISLFKFKNLEKRFIICERLLGSHPSTISLALCEHLGEQIAEIHTLNIPKSVSSLFTKQELPSFILDLDFRTVLNNERFQFFLEEKAFIENLNRKAKDLPLGIGHCDFFPDNALTLVENGRETISAFLDWYDARNTYLLLDLAVIAISWCSNNFKIISDKEQALLRGYQKVRPLHAKELKLWNGFLRAAAFFFWISREDYHAQMHQQGKTNDINPKKTTEEFYELLKFLRTRE